MVDWVKSQSLALIVTCLGDGHDGIWNIVHDFAPEHQRREVLDWFHLMENLHKIGDLLHTYEFSLRLTCIDNNFVEFADLIFKLIGSCLFLMHCFVRKLFKNLFIKYTLTSSSMS